MTCQRENCTCQIEEGLGYCSPTCRTGVAENGDICLCGHADCETSTGEAEL